MMAAQYVLGAWLKARRDGPLAAGAGAAKWVICQNRVGKLSWVADDRLSARIRYYPEVCAPSLHARGLASTLISHYQLPHTNGLRLRVHARRP